MVGLNMSDNKIKFKKLHPDAVMPKRANPSDAGLDLTAISKTYDEENGCVVYGTGLAVQLPANTVGLLFPRSSIYKQPFSLANSVGVLDEAYRGEIKFIFRIIDRPRKCYEVGDRVGQLVILPCITEEAIIVKSLNNTDRGEKGFGSSGS